MCFTRRVVDNSTEKRPIGGGGLEFLLIHSKSSVDSCNKIAGLLARFSLTFPQKNKVIDRFSTLAIDFNTFQYFSIPEFFAKTRVFSTQTYFRGYRRRARNFSKNSPIRVVFNIIDRKIKYFFAREFTGSNVFFGVFFDGLLTFILFFPAAMLITCRRRRLDTDKKRTPRKVRTRRPQVKEE